MNRVKVRRARVISLSLLLGMTLVGFSLLLVRAQVNTVPSTLTVNSTTDAGGSCPGANCTLRQAIATAASGDTIIFSLPANSVIDLTSRELAIDKNLTIKGPGANLLSVQRNTSAGNFRIFHIGVNFSVTISGLSIANGATNTGAGVYNDGVLTLTDSTISGNIATGSYGGGIYGASGATTIINCTISGNVGGAGGGISSGTGSITITNTTISGNSTGTEGGGIYLPYYSAATGRITITNSTITGNTAGTLGGGIRNTYDLGHGTLVTLKNTIIAGNTATTSGPDISGELTSQGYNLIGKDAGLSNLTPTTVDQIGTAASSIDPKLGPLQFNGGPTRTHALLGGSPAIDRGISSGSNTDQRGFIRPVDDPFIGNANGGDGADTGAYEIQADQLPGCNVISRVVSNNNDSGAGSLRDTIANVCAGTTITFAPNVRGAINLTSGELPLNKSLTIAGPGANLLTVQRAASAANFRILNLTPNSVIVSISGLTIANGNAPSNGGGISNTGTLTIANSTISGNNAVSGGGIVSSRALTVINSTISGNAATDGFGGGIYSTGVLNINNSTISGNSARVVGFAVGSGGGIQNGSGNITITNSTVCGNTAEFRGGGIMSSNGTLISRNTIIAQNTAPASGGGPDVFGALTSQGFNLIGNSSGASIAPVQSSDQIGTAASPIDPLLGSLQNYGGQTSTRALLSGSPAIDKGNSSGAATDQRGFTRPFGIANVNGGDGSDIGAFEIQLNCSYSINPINQSFPASGGTNSVNVMAPGSCAWTTVNNSPAFITITSGASGTGNGAVNYSVAANSNTNSRTGSLTIAGQMFNVTQDGVTGLVSNVQFSAINYSTGEGNNSATITVTRTGDTTGTATVDFANSDLVAQQRTDYTTTAGTLTFAPGQTSKTFDVLIVDDGYVEGSETLNLTLSNPTGGAVLGSASTAVLTIVDNDSGSASTNPLDNADERFFVRQQFYDFLSRLPDQGGFDFWTGQITQCGTNQTCINNKRLDVSNAFFFELEYQQTGAYVFRLYRAAFGNTQPFPNPDNSNLAEARKLPSYAVFARDRASVVGGASLAQSQLDLANAFVARPEFLAKYPASQNGPTFVDAILATIRNDTGADLAAQRTALINLFNTGGRGAVLCRLADDNVSTNPINNRAFIDAEYNRAFVATQYFGYLRRDSDVGGFLFWVGQVNSGPLRDTTKQHAMVCAFVTSAEYQQRFSSIATHSNAECQ